MVDFKRIVARAKEILPPVYVYIKPITGRPPEILRTLETDFWKKWPDKRAESFARFLALAKSGHPYEREMVIEDVPGRSNLPEFAQALQFQQRDHMERSVEYGKKDARPGREVAVVEGRFSAPIAAALLPGRSGVHPGASRSAGGYRRSISGPPRTAPRRG